MVIGFKYAAEKNLSFMAMITCSAVILIWTVFRRTVARNVCGANGVGLVVIA